MSAHCVVFGTSYSRTFIKCSFNINRRESSEKEIKAKQEEDKRDFDIMKAVKWPEDNRDTGDHS